MMEPATLRAPLEQNSWRVLQANSISKGDKPVLRQGLGQAVCNHLLDRGFFGDLFPNKMDVNIDVLGPGMKLRVLREGHSALIVAENHNRLRGVDIGIKLL
jgi:hypothetical protein